MRLGGGQRPPGNPSERKLGKHPILNGQPGRECPKGVPTHAPPAPAHQQAAGPETQAQSGHRQRQKHHKRNQGHPRQLNQGPVEPEKMPQEKNRPHGPSGEKPFLQRSPGGIKGQQQRSKGHPGRPMPFQGRKRGQRRQAKQDAPGQGRLKKSESSGFRPHHIFLGNDIPEQWFC